MSTWSTGGRSVVGVMVVVAAVGMLAAWPGPVVEATAHWLRLAPPAVRPGRRADRAVVLARRRELILYDGLEEVGRFPVSIAANGLGKTRRGDRKLPRGRYRLGAGRDSRSGFGRFVPVHYPGPVDAAQGLVGGAIDVAAFRRVLHAARAGTLPPQDTALGGAIGLHGPPAWLRAFPEPVQRLQRWFRWTAGCVALTAGELRLVEGMLRDGALVEFR